MHEDESTPTEPADAPPQRFGTTNRPVNVIVHRPPPTGWRRRLPALFRAVEFGAILAVIAVAVPVVTFWYQSAYLPTTLPAGLTVTATLTESKHAPESSDLDDMTAFEATIRVKNAGTRRVAVIAANYRLWGIHLTRRDEGAYEQDMIVEQSGCGGSPLGGRYLRQTASPLTLLGTGRIMDGWWFDGGQDAEDHPLFFVPTGQFDVALLEVTVWVAKGDLVSQADSNWIAWAPSELVGAKDPICGFELDGIMSDRPLYSTAWAVKNRTPILGGLFPDPRLISVEWRPVAWVGRDSGGSKCDPFDTEQSLAPCTVKLTVGATGEDSWIEPVISYCPSGINPNSCKLVWTMSLSGNLDLEQELGFAASSASASIVLWPGPSQSPSPEGFVP